MEILKKRADFLSVAKAGRVHKSAFTLQFKDKLEEEARFGVNTRFGFTVTKKVGNAVVRNRIKRRLKAAVRGLKISDAHKDYVLIARLPALSMKYQSIVSELEVALAHSNNMQSHKNKKVQNHERE